MIRLVLLGRCEIQRVALLASSQPGFALSHVNSCHVSIYTSSPKKQTHSLFPLDSKTPTYMHKASRATQPCKSRHGIPDSSSSLLLGLLRLLGRSGHLVLGWQCSIGLLLFQSGLAQCDLGIELVVVALLGLGLLGFLLLHRTG